MQKSFSHRVGDRAEYLAQYIFSAFAISVVVPRQEDVGVDFHCSLLRREGNNLRPYLPFTMQVKSRGDKVLKEGIRYGGITEAGNWRKHEIDQLCQTDTPFLIGLVDTDEQYIDVFSTITRFFVLYNWKREGLPREVALMPYEPKDDVDLGDGVWKDVEAKPNMPGKFWTLPIGQPILRIPIEDSESDEKCEQIKSSLEPFLRMDQENAVFARIGLGYFNWPLKIRPGQALNAGAVGLVSHPVGSPSVQSQLRVTARIIASLLTSYRLSGKKKEIQEWEAVLQQLPIASEPDAIKSTVQMALDFAHAQ